MYTKERIVSAVIVSRIMATVLQCVGLLVIGSVSQKIAIGVFLVIIGHAFASVATDLKRDLGKG
jgi:vacuolar-type H+-ATPase subunit I/STV1